MERVAFAEVPRSDLVIDRVYAGGSCGHRGDDPISKILPVGNAGGFRFLGSPSKGTVRALVLYTSLSDAEWPDRLDLTTGLFTYFGDNKTPGRELHDTPRKGNLALRTMFHDALSEEGRKRVPPILLFSKAGKGSDVVFRGLIVPGSPTIAVDENLVAIWRSFGSERFQNYRARFTVLDERRLSREWLDQLASGRGSSLEPTALVQWRRTGLAVALRAPRPAEHRSREQQLPVSAHDQAMLGRIHSYFVTHPSDFEHCAAQLWWMLAPATEELEVTRPSRDGGRDAVGKYKIGPPSDQIKIDFALEAKCYAPTQGAGVRDIARLISRLRHRDFGVFVTTSFVNGQAYREVREDRHPVAIVAGRDIVDVLKMNGISTPKAVTRWLEETFGHLRRSRMDLAYPELAIDEAHVSPTAG